MIEFRASTQSDVPALRQLWQEAFGDPEEYLDIFFRRTYAPERSRVICRDSAIIGGAYWFDCALREQKLAYLYAVAIKKSCQSCGLGSRLMEDIHRHLTGQGYSGVLLVPGDEGLRRYYQRFGYRTVSYHSEYPPVTGARITAERYALLRRSLLPENGVIQAGENLAFLNELAFFYENEDSICAVSRQGNRCLELLGSDAPARKTPYAMGKSLTADPLPDPLYFGFGFD